MSAGRDGNVGLAEVGSQRGEVIDPGVLGYAVPDVADGAVLNAGDPGYLHERTVAGVQEVSKLLDGHAQSMQKFLPSRNTPREKSLHLSDERGRGQDSAMPHRRARFVAAENLRLLREYCEKHPDFGPTSDRQIAQRIKKRVEDGEEFAPVSKDEKQKITRQTVATVLDGSVSTGIDTLDSIARCYGRDGLQLRAWQLLVPNFDPADPPTLSVTEAEKDLKRRLIDVRIAFERAEVEEARGGQGKTHSADRHPESTISGKTGIAPVKTKRRKTSARSQSAD